MPNSEQQTSDNFVKEFEFGPSISDPVTKKLINFHNKGYSIDYLKGLNPSQYEEWFRPMITSFLKQFNGFGVGDIKQSHDAARVNSGPNAPDGERGKAYGNICFPFKGDEKNNSEYSTTVSGSKKKGTTVDPQCGKSSCGVVVRSLWQLLGARHTNYINPPYTTNQVMTFLRDYAVYCGAFYGTFEGSDIKPIRLDKYGVEQECQPKPIKLFDPKQGDVIFLQGAKYKKDNKEVIDNSAQHVFTIINVTEKSIISCDGGQHGIGIPIRAPGGSIKKISIADGNCNGIRYRSHKRTGGLNLETFDLAKGPVTRLITGWVKITELEFPGTLIIPQRNSGEVVGTKPDGTEDRVKYYLPEPSPN